MENAQRGQFSQVCCRLRKQIGAEEDFLSYEGPSQLCRVQLPYGSRTRDPSLVRVQMSV